MSNRALTRYDDGCEGMHECVTIERSAAGQPGIMITINRYDGDLLHDQMCVSIPNGDAFLAPVNEWLAR